MRRDFDSGLEVKVVDPPSSVDSKDQKIGDAPSPPRDRRRRQRPPPHPSHDELIDFRPFRSWVPWLVPTFVVANIVLFMAAMYVNNCPENSPKCVAAFLGRFSFQPLKENPLLGPSAATLVKMGALDVSEADDTRRHQTWRLFTCIWLHAGVFHVLANMLSLIFIGIRLEQEFGFVRIGLLYVISGFGGSLMSALFIQTGISVGASGALFGLLGSMLSELITNWTIYANKLAALLTLLFIILLNLGVGILPHVDNFAHFGGFFSGFFLGFVFLIRPQYGYVSKKKVPPGYIAVSHKSKHKNYQYALWVSSAIILITGYTIGLVLLLHGKNLMDDCSWCHKVTCPVSKWCKVPAHCESIQLGNNLNLTCISNGRSQGYEWSDDTASQLQQLCSQLCN